MYIVPQVYVYVDAHALGEDGLSDRKTDRQRNQAKV
jgi:hypothetical protein